MVRQLPTVSDLPIHGWAPYSTMHLERIRAHAKHGDHGSMESKAWDSSWWLPVLGEEFGEVARVICEFNLGNITREEMKNQLRKELVQVGAMTAAWLDALGEVEWGKGEGE